MGECVSLLSFRKIIFILIMEIMQVTVFAYVHK